VNFRKEATDLGVVIKADIQIGLDRIVPRYTMHSGTRQGMVFPYLKFNRPPFGERIQPLKAMFSRATLGSGRLLFSGERR